MGQLVRMRDSKTALSSFWNWIIIPTDFPVLKEIELLQLFVMMGSREVRGQIGGARLGSLY